MLKHFIAFNSTLQRLFILHCNDDFIKFLSECILNILEGNITMQKGDRKDLKMYSQMIASIIKRRASLSKRRILLSTDEGLELIKTIAPKIGIHFSGQNDTKK